MQLFCPSCQAAFPGTQRCPRCGGLLLLPQEAAEAAYARPRAELPPPIQTTPTGRVVVGAVLALGLYLGLRKLAIGAVLAASPDPDAWWSSFEGLLAACSAQGLAVLFGAVVAAAGRAVGFAFGAAVGGLCGTLFLGAELLAGAPPRDLVLYVQLAVLVLVGGIAGMIAARVWGAVPVLDLPVSNRNRLSSSRFAVEPPPSDAPPTAWARVLVGAMIMLVALAAADQVRTGAERVTEGALHVNSVGQGRFLTWQIAVFGILTGGAVAGAATGAGVRHGFMTGMIGGFGAVGLAAARGEQLPPVRYWLSKLALGEAAANDPAVLAAAVGGVALFGLVGGWLGGSLFQPLAPLSMRRRARTGLD